MIDALASAAIVVLIALRWRPRPPVRVVGAVPSPFVGPAPSRAPAAGRASSSRRARRRSPIEPADVAVWCEALARVVRSGSTLSSALRDVEPATSFAAIVDDITLALGRGRSLTDALHVRHPSPHLGLALGVLRACSINGGPPAEPLDRAAATLRRRAIADAERRTQSAQARLSAVVMTVLPLAMLLLLLVTSSATRHAVVTPIGAGAVVAGAALNGIGWCWMRHIIGRGIIGGGRS